VAQRIISEYLNAFIRTRLRIIKMFFFGNASDYLNALLRTRLRRAMVELGGFEPPSKQGTHMLSTCLLYFVFSRLTWQYTTELILSFLFLPGHQSLNRTISICLAPHLQQAIEKHLLRDVSSLATLSQD